MQQVIHPDQSCGIRGRYIGENIVLLNSVFQYSLEMAVPGAFSSLDQEKAFDRVDHSFLFNVLSHVGFGPSYISWVKLLYSGISSVVCINGYTSDAFLPTRGVRQGCLLSLLLYVLTIEILAAKFRACSSRGLLPPFQLFRYTLMTQPSSLFQTAIYSKSSGFMPVSRRPHGL